MPRFGQRPHTPLPRPRWTRPDLTASLSAPRERQRITRARSNSPSRTATSRGHRRQREVGGPHLRLAPRAHVTAGEIQRSVTRWIATDIEAPCDGSGLGRLLVVGSWAPGPHAATGYHLPCYRLLPRLDRALGKALQMPTLVYATLRSPSTRKAPPRRSFSVPFDPRTGHGRYWARTSDLRLVEAALSQLS
jgi:hypothetical protein